MTGGIRTGEAEAIRFLALELVPRLPRSERPLAEKAIKGAQRAGSMKALAALPERVRRELLGSLEELVGGLRRPDPSVTVELTTALAGLPARPAPPLRLALPAR